MLPNFLAKLGPGKGPLPTMVGGADTADWNAVANFSGIWLTTNIRNSDQAAAVPRGSINPGSLLQVSERHNRLDELGTSWSDLTIHNMVLILQFSQEAARSDVPSVRIQPPQLLRGLRWLAKTALMQSLMDILNNYLMGSFLKGSGQPKDRKEAIPIPFAILVMWEQAIVSQDTPEWTVLLLGGLLLAVWARLTPLCRLAKD